MLCTLAAGVVPRCSNDNGGQHLRVDVDINRHRNWSLHSHCPPVSRPDDDQLLSAGDRWSLGGVGHRHTAVGDSPERNLYQRNRKSNLPRRLAAAERSTHVHGRQVSLWGVDGAQERSGDAHRNTFYWSESRVQKLLRNAALLPLKRPHWK